ncbi:MAG: His/Gly/Thr/Pro-type tRNA ligase C-terminal domain-containing protein, partial [Bacilli bacterium]
MGCYGMGISRLMMAVLEQHNQDLKVCWPQDITPFDVHIIPMDKAGSFGYQEALILADSLIQANVDVLIDDRNETAGVKFNDADLIGIRYRIIVGRKIKEGFVEVKDMLKQTTEEVTLQDLKNYQWK